MNIFKDPILFPQEIPFGLDLSDLSVKIVQLGFTGKKCNVVRYGSTFIAPGNVMDGEIKSQDGVRDALVRCRAKSGVKTKKVFCSLPEGKSFLRVIETPRLSDTELEEAIAWQVEENIPMGLDQLYYDWLPLQRNFSQDPKKMNILLVAVARGIVDAFLEVLESAGLQIVGMGTESMAQVQSLLAEDVTSKETVLIVDIGDRRTTFTFAVGGTPCFTSSVSLSSQMMTDAIAKTLRIPTEEAEKLKLEQGIGSFVKKDPLFRSVEPVLENLIRYLQTSMDFFVTGLKFSRSVDRIILCGGGSNAEGFSVYLGKRLGKLVERGNPWVRMNIQEVLPAIPYQDALRYSTAIGLAWQGFQSVQPNRK